jgi:hypothetical protein
LTPAFVPFGRGSPVISSCPQPDTPKKFKIQAPNGPFRTRRGRPSDAVHPTAKGRRCAALEGTRLGRPIGYSSTRAHYKNRSLSGALYRSIPPPLPLSHLLHSPGRPAPFPEVMRRNLFLALDFGFSACCSGIFSFGRSSLADFGGLLVLFWQRCVFQVLFLVDLSFPLLLVRFGCA